MDYRCRVAAVMKNGDALKKYAYRIKVSEVQSCQDDKSLVVHVPDWLIGQAIAVYALSGNVNDIFLHDGV